MVNGIKALLIGAEPAGEGDALVTFRVPADARLYTGEYLLVQAFAVELAKAQSVECSRQPEPAADPQETADPGQGIDIPETVKSSDVSDARETRRLRPIEKAAIASLLYLPDTPIDTAKTAIPEPVPARTLEGDSDPSHNGTQLAETVTLPVKPTQAMLNAAIDVDAFKLGDISPLGFRCSPQQLFEQCYAAMIRAAAE